MADAGAVDKAFLGLIGTASPNQVLGIYTNSAGWNTFNVMTNGSIAIGSQSTNANAVLDVSGNIYCSSKIYIGTADAATATQMATYALGVNGTAMFTKAKVKLYGNWPDYVFEEKYHLLPLSDLENYLKQHSHLPEVPDEAEVKKDGIDLGENQAIMLKKIEELTLYIIKQNKTNIEQQEQINNVSIELANLKTNPSR